MRKNFSQVFLVIAGLLLIATGCWVVWRASSFIWDQFVKLPPELAVGLLTAASTVLVATATVVLGRNFERQREIESHFRARKLEIYDEFLKELFKIFNSHGAENEGLADFLREWQRKMIVWGGSDVLTKYIAWMGHMKSVPPNAESFFKMGDLFLEMRRDLGLSNRNISRQTFVHTILRNSELFLSMARKNPNVTLAEMSELEKSLGL